MTDLLWRDADADAPPFTLDAHPRAWELLRAALDLPAEPSAPAHAGADIVLRAPRLTDAQLRALRDLTSPGAIKTDSRERILRAYGKSFRDRVRLRQGAVPNPPDAVVYPATEDQVARVLAFCGANDCALIPFGGGTNTVGAVEARDARVTLALDLARLNRVLALDEISQTVTAEAGIRGGELERALNARGLTLGYAFEPPANSTLGGGLARRGELARSAHSARIVTPRGILEAREPAQLQCALGSEGALGVITAATLGVCALPKTENARAWLFKNFAEGVAAMRVLTQSGLAPTFAHLADAAATRWWRSVIVEESPRGWAGFVAQIRRQWFGDPRSEFDAGVVLVLGFANAASANAAWAQCAAHGAFDLGCAWAAAWSRARTTMPAWRDAVFERGALMDTMELTTAWADVARVQAALLAAMPAAQVWIEGVRAEPATLDLRITFWARLEAGREIARWEEMRAALIACARENGAALAAHAGIGYENGAGYYVPAALGALKALLDPGNVLNPGKWLVAATASSQAQAIEYQERFWNLPANE